MTYFIQKLLVVLGKPKRLLKQGAVTNHRITNSPNEAVFIVKKLISSHFLMYLYRIYKLSCFNPFRPEFTIVIFIHYKPRIAVAILDL